MAAAVLQHGARAELQEGGAVGWAGGRGRQLQLGRVHRQPPPRPCPHRQLAAAETLQNRKPIQIFNFCYNKYAAAQVSLLLCLTAVSVGWRVRVAGSVSSRTAARARSPARPVYWRQARAQDSER